jgi:hypothetical protein
MARNGLRGALCCLERRTKESVGQLGEISGSHGGENNEDVCLRGCCAV